MLRVQLWHLRAVAALHEARRRTGADAQRLLREARRAVTVLAKQPIRSARPLAELTRCALDAAEGRPEQVQQGLGRAIEPFDNQDMRLYAAATRIRLGQLLGGTDG